MARRCTGLQLQTPLAVDAGHAPESLSAQVTNFASVTQRFLKQHRFQTMTDIPLVFGSKNSCA